MPSSAAETPEHKPKGKADMAELKYIFGPVASRRLGLSLGVDILPLKTCSFDCLYCELGRTTHKTIQRTSYFPPDEILAELRAVLTKQPTLDYITFSGSGEPTLNRDIGTLIRETKRFSQFPVAVLTNGSLLRREDVQLDLMEADLVIPSLDAASEEVFQKINRPADGLSADQMARGIADFTRKFSGETWLEILFCKGINDSEKEIEQLATRALVIGAEKIQLTTVFRPPAERSVEPVSIRFLETIRPKFGPSAEVVGPPRTRKKMPSQHVEKQILALVRRRPTPVSELAMALGMTHADALRALESLRTRGVIEKVNHQNEDFYTASQ
jgi:wyosine [tRNA(Phe)-imidazoG37] synthetase (radical SAM superfamily)